MSPAAYCFRGLLIRAITGRRPAMVVSVADDTRLDALCEQLARAERVAELFQHHGIGKAGDPIDKTLAALLSREKPCTK
jgi:hypothetical protein